MKELTFRAWDEDDWITIDNYSLEDLEKLHALIGQAIEEKKRRQRTRMSNE